MKKSIKTKKSPGAIGPYSQALQSGNFVFCSGQIPLHPDGSMSKGDIREQTAQILENIKNIMEAADLSLNSIVKTTVFLTDLNDFQVMNEIYGKYFQEPYPARSTIQVAKLPKGSKIEIEAIAKIEQSIGVWLFYW